MKFVIKHEIRGRLHVHLIQKRMTFEEADTLQYYLSTNKYITSVKVYQRTCDVAVTYVGGRAEIIKAFQRFAYSKVDGAGRFYTEFRQGTQSGILGQACQQSGTPLWKQAVFTVSGAGSGCHDKVCPLYLGRHQVSGTR